jgi:hypothetical protein
MRIILIAILSAFFALQSNAQIGLDTLFAYPGSFVPSVMLCDSSGNIIIAGVIGQNPAMAKYNPDSGLIFINQYNTPYDNSENHISNLTFDKEGNIYTHNFAEFDKSWVRKYSPTGQPLGEIIALAPIQVNSNKEYGHISYKPDHKIEFVCQNEDTDELLRYVFDSAFSSTIKVDTFDLNSEYLCCILNPIYGDQETTIFPGKVNNEQGVFELKEELRFRSFNEEHFIDGEYLVFGINDGNLFTAHNSYEYIGGDTIGITNPQLVVFDSNAQVLSKFPPFSTLIDTSSNVTRPFLRDLIIHPDYGVLAVGILTLGLENPAKTISFIAQIHPSTLEIIDIWYEDNNRIFYHIESIGRAIYALDGPIGFPSGFNLVKLEFNEITSVQKQKTSYRNFEVYPNPTKGVLTIKGETQLIGQDYIIYSAIGKMVMSGRLNHQIDVNQLSKGLYILSIENGQNSIFIKE